MSESNDRRLRRALALTMEELENAYEFLDDMPTDIWDMLGDDARQLSEEGE